MLSNEREGNREIVRERDGDGVGEHMKVEKEFELNNFCA